MADPTQVAAGRRTRGIARRARVAADAPPARTAERGTRRTASRTVLSAVVMTLAAGLVATIALPSYAYDPTTAGVEGPAPERSLSPKGEQQFVAPEQIEAVKLQRDGFKATSPAALRRQAYRQLFTSYSGPTAADFLKNPAHPPFSLSAVYNTGLQYRGVPYVFGGADPSGFDCSGFIMFVYAQYGIALPHSVHGQDAIGTPISPADAQIGDVIIFNDHSHDGIYAGDGLILHAPYRGASVRVQPLWRSDVHFVRFGI